MMTDPDTARPPPIPHPDAATASWRSTELLRGEREVLITHQDETYRLRLTRNGKLILTK